MAKKNKIKVKLEVFHDDDEPFLRHFLNIFSYNKYMDKEIEFTTSSHFDFLVVFNRSYSLFFPERTLIYPMEPLWSEDTRKDNYYRSKHIVVADYGMFPTSSVYSEFFSPMPCNISPKNTIKTKNISMVVSFDKRGAHILDTSEYYFVLYNFRVKLAIKLAEISLEIEGGGVNIFGKNWIPDGNNIKGSIMNKRDGLDNYRFSICIENTIQKNYVSEKFWDAVMANSVPIYIGCNNIEEYIPADSFINLTPYVGDMDLVIKKIQYISENAETLYLQYAPKLEALKQDFFKNKTYNLYLFIVDKIKNIVNSGKVKNESPKLSIIVPVYNVEKYLSECLDSLIYQTFEDIEIIIVNDKSQDNSQQIIDNYAQKDKRIVVLQHDKNKGLGEARNSGMKLAKGEYIAFVDSDDYVDKKFAEEIYTLIQKDNTIDVFLFGFYSFDDSSKKIFEKNLINLVNIKEIKSNTPFYALDIGERAFFLYGGLWSITSITWNKVYKKDFITKNNLHFHSIIHEDETWGIEVMYNNAKIIYLDKCYYFYRINRQSSQQSLVQESFIGHSVDVVKAFELAYQFLKNKDFYNSIRIFFLKYALLAIMRHLFIKKEKYLKHLFNEMKKFMLMSNVTLEDINKFNIDNNYKKYLECILNSDITHFLKLEKNILKQQLQDNSQELQKQQEENQRQYIEYMKLQSLYLSSYQNASLLVIIKNRLREKLVDEKWLKYPKIIRYCIYSLKMIKLGIKKLFKMI